MSSHRPHPARVIAALVAGIALTGSGTPAVAGPLSDPRVDQERIDGEVAEAAATLEHATDRARAAAARYAAAEAALPTAEAGLADARGELAAARAYADTTEREAARAARNLRTAGERVDEATAAVELARDNVSTLASAAYKGGRIAGFRLMLRAHGPADAGTRLGYLDHISGLERAALDQFSGARLRARQAENRAGLAHAEAETARAQAGAAVVAAQASESKAQAAAALARELAADRAEALDVAEAEREESLARYRQVEREAERIAEQVREWEAQQAAQAAAAAEPQSSAADSTVLMMPTQGWQSSPFGMRRDPFYGGWRLHAGLDIAAPGGAAIAAADGGTVIRAGWSGGYGFLTCLGHGTHQGQGLSTCYAHQSRILVSQGQSVNRGELIGRVGTTGASTGDHLHFEVRLDGTPTDPVPFLPDCLC